MTPALAATVAGSLAAGGVVDIVAVGGGDIHSAWRLELERGVVFVKTNGAAHAALLDAEAAALAALAASGAVAVPAVLGGGIDDGTAWLALEYIEFGGSGGAGRLGSALAALHRSTAPRFGFDGDNFIGYTPQPNAWAQDWPTFFRERRLEPQLRLAAADGHGDVVAAVTPLLDALPRYFDGVDTVPSLLHGDLWGGNWATRRDDGAPVLYDPAAYYGDRETDLAMTELFGGFPAEFYRRYDEAWARDPGYSRRRPLYQLYHALNHLHLFGAGYAGLCRRLADEARASQ
ncbi:MAG: fructosamine kinase family protein [Pseudomonadota bacterium]